MKRWRSKHYLIPEQHEPGVQRGYGMRGKGARKQPSHTPGGRGNARKVNFWQVGRWAGGAVK